MAAHGGEDDAVDGGLGLTVSSPVEPPTGGHLAGVGGAGRALRWLLVPGGPDVAFQDPDGFFGAEPFLAAAGHNDIRVSTI